MHRVIPSLARESSWILERTGPSKAAGRARCAQRRRFHLWLCSTTSSYKLNFWSKKALKNEIYYHTHNGHASTTKRTHPRQYDDSLCYSNQATSKENQAETRICQGFRKGTDAKQHEKIVLGFLQLDFADLFRIRGSVFHFISVNNLWNIRKRNIEPLYRWFFYGRYSSQFLYCLL